ncbi:phosphoribosylformylglycinamidine cyclo-ligase [Ktedonobacter racemifer]|uniref:Multifunctional fusion protein n=1 Tax=Ktedonobacter racemifer DSM 44963 TaxID=485913 RepID=D6TQR6_KTERA|nr:phosphoribosylformylglycinamidine cyclo-ligase [Ktedonobacter racemifer]EFH87733.1 phosphoribosylformylglycinamidine cyclo-ligase [Ktedonobacter racemifer DSM 44963]
MTRKPRALVLRAPGINCDREMAYACRLVGFETELVHINQLLKNPESLLEYHFLALPGGFSYGDDLGAGTLLAKNLTIHLGDQLRRFVADGRLVLGVCNGFQVLVRAGLLPGVLVSDGAGDVARASLTENALAQFECRWITLVTQPSNCVFTQGIDKPVEFPVAHGEGQFVYNGDLSELHTSGQLPLVYATPAGRTGEMVQYPANPNGSMDNIAGACNAQGNVFGLMPHPERFVSALQHPQRRSLTGDIGDGLLIFQNAFNYAQKFVSGEGVTPVSRPEASPLASQSVAGASSATSAAQAPSVTITPLSYAESGVDVIAGEQAVRLMKKAVQSTHGPEVLESVGAFAGAMSLHALDKMRRPALVSSTDGVGTKTLIAAQAKCYDTIGYDIVNHSVNDLLMMGARPLFFMDYVAVNKLDPVQVARIVQGVAEACKEAGCALLGGETAEMPDVYMPGAFDLAGTIVGIVEQDEIVNGSTISVGDYILGLPSSGLHTNGYSLVRKLFAQTSLDTVYPELGEPLADALLRPHRCYLREVQEIRSYLADRGRFIKGMAHITGGGFQGNISRVLPPGTQAEIETGSWQVPPLFQLLARLSSLPQEELYRTFNMGIGMIFVLSPKSALEARSILPELVQIGTIREGQGAVLIH